MTWFRYDAASASGQIVRGVEEAPTAAALQRALGARRLYPVLVVPVPGGGRGRRRRGGWASRRSDLTEAVVTLAALLEAGLPLEQALEVTAEGAARADVRAAFTDLQRVVRDGGRIADAVQARADVFPPIAVGLTEAGERGGQLAEAMRRLATVMERDGALRARVLGALTYPAILAVVGLGAAAFLVLLVLPRFVDLLGEAGARLPVSTLVLLAVSRAATRYGWILAAAAAALSAAAARQRGSVPGRERMDGWLLRTPLIGDLRAGYAAAQVARTLGNLLAGGVPLVPALDVAADSVPDAAIAAQLRTARTAVRRGETLSAMLASGSGFPHTFVRLVAVGEKTGELDAMLLRAAALMEADVERRLARVVTFIEPVLILFFGLLVGGVALSLLQAVYGIHADAL